MKLFLVFMTGIQLIACAQAVPNPIASSEQFLFVRGLKENPYPETYFDNIPTATPNHYIDLSGGMATLDGCNDETGKRIYADNILVEWSYGRKTPAVIGKYDLLPGGDTPVWTTKGILTAKQMPEGAFDSAKEFFNSQYELTSKAVSNQETIFDTGFYQVTLRENDRTSNVHSTVLATGHDKFYEFYEGLSAVIGGNTKMDCVETNENEPSAFAILN